MEEPLPMTVPQPGSVRPTAPSRRHALLQTVYRLLAAGSAVALLGCATVTPTQAPAGAEQVRAPASPTSPPPEVPAAPVDAAAPTGPYAPRAARGRLDPAQDAERGDLWERVRAGFALPEIDNELVRKWEQWYARDPAYVERMTQRGGRYLYHVMDEIEKRGLPAELALLPFIESAFNPQAVSHARASGMWQFMPATGKDFELRQNVFRDDRRDVLASTRAALDYLQRLNGQFNDWPLALAAYNWGQGNVSKAIERNRRAGLPTDCDSLRLPSETREYGPKLQAVKNIVLQPQRFGLVLPSLQNHPFFLSVPIERDIDVALAAQLAGLSIDAFQQLNPQMNKPVMLAAGTPRVLLPYDNANRFIQEMASHSGPLATWTAWVAPRTLKPAEAARLTGMTEQELRAVNLIPPRMLVKAGSTLLVPRAAHTQQDVAGPVVENAMLSLAQESRPRRRVSLKAGRQGVTVAAIARHYRLQPSQVALWNGITPQGRFKPGQAITLMLPPAPDAASGGARPALAATAATAATRRSAARAATHHPARASAHAATPPIVTRHAAR
jgi:membrane-bound lytic murein transglycosylase D